MLVSKLHGKLVSIFCTFSISCCSVVMLIFLSLLVFLVVGLLRNYHIVFYFSLLFDRYVGVSQSKGSLLCVFHLTILCTFICSQLSCQYLGHVVSLSLDCSVRISDTFCFPCCVIVPLVSQLQTFSFPGSTIFMQAFPHIFSFPCCWIVTLQF